MKKFFFNIPAVLVTVVMLASFVVPVNLAMPYAASADPGIMRWDTVVTPGFEQLTRTGRFDVVNPHLPLGSDNARGSEVIAMSVSGSSNTVGTVVKIGDLTGGVRSTATSTTQGILWDYGSNDPDYLEANAYKVYESDGAASRRLMTRGGVTGPKATSRSFDGVGLDANETIRWADQSQGYGSGNSDIALVTSGGANGGRILIRSANTWGGWNAQLNANGAPGNPLTTNTNSGIDYLAVKFSPTYGSDSSIVVVYADNTTTGGGATYYNIGYRDTSANAILQWLYPAPGLEVKNPASANFSSPDSNQVNTVDLHLPSDFSGQSPSLRRAYISIDAYGSGGINPVTLVPNPKLATAQDGIYRIDDSTVYVLMDTSNTPEKSIYSIAYYGTYASGKLMAGERTGFPCSATAPIWFTDSPTTCPIPCWYPALKPPTGAANQGTCANGSKTGIGAATVDWNADGSMAYAATSSLADTVYAGQPGWIIGVPVAGGTTADKAVWFQMYTWDPVPNDESALSISRNNGETWNQLAIIDTTIDWFNDVAVAPDCTTIYLASVNRNTGLAGYCNEFDSVWRASVNPNVTSPLPAIPPLGTYWERVYARTTSSNCGVAQSDLPILRLVNSCADKQDGEIVGWAAQGSGTAPGGATGGGVMAWSPDYGDYWATISPRNVVQDFAFESSTLLYVVNRLGMVQRLPFSGTSWSTNLPSAFSLMDAAHTIVAIPDGKVLVGAGAGAQFPSSYSADKGVSWAQSPALAGHGNEHVIFDVDFKNNSFIYMGDDTPGTITGSVYRNTAPSYATWADNDMMKAINGATSIPWPAGTVRPPHPRGQFGLVQAWTGTPQPTLYSAHENITYSGGATWGSAVCRALKPRDGMPKTGIQWDCLDIFAPLTTAGVRFTLEPSSLKACGCCTMDTSTTLYAIDNESGGSTAGVLNTVGGRWWNSANPVEGAAVYAVGYAPYMAPTAALNLWGNGPQGMLWAYTDCLAKKGPVLRGPEDQALIGADPVTGRNQQIDLSWEQLCLATVYELQIAKDKAMTLRINPAVDNVTSIASVTGSILLPMDVTNMTSPAAWIAPGALPEAGAIYYWRIRAFQSATLQLARSPWSTVRSFTIKAGFIVNTPYYGVQLLAPNNACTGCKVKPVSFSWSPWKEATKYQFDLAKDPEFKTLVTTANPTTTGYEYSGTLDYSTNYFWRVKALEVNGLNIPSDWSATFSLQTEPAPASAPAPTTTPPFEQQGMPVWAWVAIAIGAILVAVTIFMIYKSRHTY